MFQLEAVLEQVENIFLCRERLQYMMGFMDAPVTVDDDIDVVFESSNDEDDIEDT